MKLLILLSLLCIESVLANEQKTILNSKTYSESSEKMDYFKFIGRSTKMGLIGSDFQGYVKKGTLQYQKTGSIVKNIQFSFPANELDTDNESRNQKMYEQCLEVSRYPEIQIQILDPVDLNRSEQKVRGQMSVHGEIRMIPIQLELVGDGLFIGNAQFKLSDFKIPDPSILVAKVDDLFKIQFRVQIPEVH